MGTFEYSLFRSLCCVGQLVTAPELLRTAALGTERIHGICKGTNGLCPCIKKLMVITSPSHHSLRIRVLTFMYVASLQITGILLMYPLA